MEYDGDAGDRKKSCHIAMPLATSVTGSLIISTVSGGECL